MQADIPGFAQLDHKESRSLTRAVAATLRGLNAALLARRHRLGSTALQAYQLGRVLVRKQSLNADLVPHIQDRRRARSL
ncbi:MAG: hypothetical protein QOH21_992 [Acidobacteriota bacterium]|jgi:hypothetical protein|nr:hypothetical protein [Acidobacteriota bacterium]